MKIPAILEDDIGLVNFTLVRGVDKAIRVDFSTDPAALDISLWSFAVNFYSGRPLVASPVLSSVAGTIEIFAVEKYIILNFTAAALAAFVSGPYQWDLRFTAPALSGQILKGSVALGEI
ncbi:MAG TPA: hypothetical protein DDY20_05750 [Desulfobulbaceae bacterium]|nr:hypothetical protein [Desulfobulbaceae bacterium]